MQFAGDLLGEEGVHFLRRGRQADEVECRTAEQRALVRGRSGREAFLGGLRADKGVYRMSAQCSDSCRRKRSC